MDIKIVIDDGTPENVIELTDAAAESLAAWTNERIRTKDGKRLRLGVRDAIKIICHNTLENLSLSAMESHPSGAVKTEADRLQSLRKEQITTTVEVPASSIVEDSEPDPAGVVQ